MVIYQIYLDVDTCESLIDLKRNFSFNEVMLLQEAIKDRDEAKILLQDDAMEQSENNR